MSMNPVKQIIAVIMVLSATFATMAMSGLPESVDGERLPTLQPTLSPELVPDGTPIEIRR